MEHLKEYKLYCEDLKSKSDKGNRYFQMLKTGMFQHYDSPKGELSKVGGEDDRKRLVTHLSKEDKKKYREWLKTPEGQESLKNFNEGLFSKSPVDKIALSILDRIKELYDPESLSKNRGENRETIYTYMLEETDSDSGYVKIEVDQILSPMDRDYYLEFDDEKVKCSESISKKFYKFFESKFKQKEEDKFTGKYKHVVEFNQFNEGIFISECDGIVRGIFDRIKDRFDIENLTICSDGYGSLLYELEETDSESGFIKMKVSDTEFMGIPGYILKIDDREIDCSFFLKRKVYSYLSKKWSEKEKMKKRADKDEFKNKYGHLTEGLFTSDYDEPIKKIFQRIKDTFDINNLNSSSYDCVSYSLEETDTESGYINISVRRDMEFDYLLWIDGGRPENLVECSQLLKRKIWKFLKSKWNEKNKIIKKGKSEEFKKKYNIY